MKHITFVSLVALCAFALALPVSAAMLQTGDEFTLAEGDTVADDLYLASGNVVLAGTVEGDVYAAGGTLYIGGTVTGDVVLAGGSITVAGAVGDDLRVVGGNVVVTGTVAGDIVAVGGSVHLAPGSSAGGDLITAAGNVRVDGTVAGELRGCAGDMTIANAVGPVDAKVGNLTLSEGAQINGTLIYSAPQEAQIADGATVAGETTFTQKERMRKDDFAGIGEAFGFGFVIVKILSLFILGLVLLWLFPRPTKETTRAALADFWPQLLRGLVALVVTPVAVIILAITLVGIPFALILLTGYVLTLIVAGLYIAFVLGSQIEAWARKKEGVQPISWMTLVIGLVVGAVLNFIPFVGWLVVFAFFLATFGALTQSWQKRIWNQRA